MILLFLTLNLKALGFCNFGGGLSFGLLRNSCYVGFRVNRVHLFAMIVLMFIIMLHLLGYLLVCFEIGWECFCYLDKKYYLSIFSFCFFVAFNFHFYCLFTVCQVQLLEVLPSLTLSYINFLLFRTIFFVLYLIKTCLLK